MGAKGAMRAWGRSKADKLPLRESMKGGEVGEEEGLGFEMTDGALPVPPPEAMGRTQDLESNRPGSASQLCPF